MTRLLAGMPARHRLLLVYLGIDAALLAILAAFALR